MIKHNLSKLKSSLSGLTSFSWILITIALIGAVFTVSQLFQGNKKNQIAETSNNDTVIVQSIGDQAVEAVDKNTPISDTNPQAIKNELLIEITDKKYLVQFGDDISPIKDFPDFYKLKVEGEGTLAEKQKTIASKPGVISAEPNKLVTADRPASPGGSTGFSRWQWGVNKINVKKAWRENKGGGVVVAVLDTGIRTDHIAFENSLAKGSISYVKKGTMKATINGKEQSCENDGNWANDVGGHGTSVASIITAPGNYRVKKGGEILKGYSKTFGKGNGLQMSGVAPNARIMTVQVLGCFGGWDEWIARGIRHAAENGADVINMSLGSDTTECAAIVKRAVKYALGKNVSIVASSGNSKKPVGCPARIPGIIAVGAVDRFGNLTSNASWGSNYGKQQSVTAPGMHIASACACLKLTNNYYMLKFNGTSAAAPFVAGTAALIKGVNNYYTPEYVKKTIQKTANNPNHGNKSHHDNYYGYGIIDAYAAVLEAKK